MDWIEEFLCLTENINSPAAFRLWTAISTIAATTERKIWTPTYMHEPVYPNLYTVLVGPPAVGKSVMVSISRRLLAGIRELHLGPDNPTKASLLDCFEKTTKMSVNGHTFPPYSAMTVLCTELGVLMSKYDTEFMADLTAFYDNIPNYNSPRRQAKSVNVEAPNLNMLIAATPDAINDVLPELAWNQGFTSRLILIFGTAPDMQIKMFKKRKQYDLSELRKRIVSFFTDLYGEVLWEDEAQDAFDFWHNEQKLGPVPNHNKLRYYCGRRAMHVLKLSMLSAISAGHGLTVTLEDFLRAKTWLLDAEKMMPDVFTSMQQKSDVQILQDLHRHVYNKYSSVVVKDRKPIPEKDIWLWLSTRAPSQNIPGLIILAERTGKLKPGLIPGYWIPAPLEDTSPLPDIDSLALAKLNPQFTQPRNSDDGV